VLFLLLVSDFSEELRQLYFFSTNIRLVVPYRTIMYLRFTFPFHLFFL